MAAKVKIYDLRYKNLKFIFFKYFLLKIRLKLMFHD